MRIYFTHYIGKKEEEEHKIEERNVEAIDVVVGKNVVRIRPTGILILENGKVTLDHKLDLMGRNRK